ncbi:MAG: ribosome maturation factor RimM [Streptosporangiaceae bacterium]
MRVIVGRIGRPHGIRGEVMIAVRTDEPDLRFAVGSRLGLERSVPAGDGPTEGAQVGGTGQDPVGQHLTVASARWHSGQLLVSFAGITDRTAAGELTGGWLGVDTSQLPGLGDPDEFRDHELIGLSVRTTSGDPVGEVTDVLHYGQDLLVVRRAGQPGQECLVPFVKAIVPEVDVRGGVVVIDPPRGLLDPAEPEE